MRHGGSQLRSTLFRVSRYPYQPLPSEDSRRLRWMYSRLTPTVYLSLARQLPYELCEMIATHCLREYAIDSIKNFYHSNSGTGSFFRGNVAQPIWARYASLDGVAYIVALSNEPTGIDVAPVPMPDGAVTTVYTAEDHLGVRDVLFSSFHNEPQALAQSTPGLWWRTTRVLGDELEGATDVRPVFIYDPISRFNLCR
jgi:hypothetical protein